MTKQALRNNRILNGNIANGSAADRKGFIASPGYRNMIENHIVTVGNSTSIFTTIAHSTHTHAQVSANHIIGT